MKLDEILDEWQRDSEVDKTELGDESLKTISLHAKYMRLYKTESLRLKSLKEEYGKLYLAKHEFYSMGPSKETEKLCWVMPARGAIIRNDIPMYLQADQDIIDANLRIAVQQEKVDLLKDIVKEVKDRRWAVRAAIEWMRWTSGG